MSINDTRFRPYRPRQPWVRRVHKEAASRAERATALPARNGIDAEAFTIGLEEELFVVDAETLDCVENLPEPFLDDARQSMGGRFKREVISSMVELVTEPHSSLAAASLELRDSRRRLVEVAQRHGLAVMACGTHPFADWRRQTLSPKERYSQVGDMLGSLSQRVHVCGLHVHVALPDPAQRIGVMNRAQGFLPLLLALSTSSPFWRGAPTGLKSYRSAAYDESPRTGLPIRFADTHEFERFVCKMEAAGFIPDRSFLWWAIRPSLNYPTLELRIADSCTSVSDTIAIAALYRCLVHALTRDRSMGAAWEQHHFLVNDENRWQAIRYGLAGRILDPSTGATQPMAVALEALVDRLMPNAEALGCAAELASTVAILRDGTSADRQSLSYQLAIAQGASPDAAIQRVAADIACWTMAA